MVPHETLTHFPSWLSVKFKIDLKTLLITCKTLNGLAHYPLAVPIFHLLVHLKSRGDCTFMAVAPILWNSFQSTLESVLFWRPTENKFLLISFQKWNSSLNLNYWGRMFEMCYIKYILYFHHHHYYHFFFKVLLYAELTQTVEKIPAGYLLAAWNTPCISHK